MSFNKNNNKAFTLPDMMIMLLILSLITVVTLPVITIRSNIKESSGGIWKNVTGSVHNIFYGKGATQGAAVGATNLGGNNTRLLLNRLSSENNDIVFTNNNNLLGWLRLLDRHAAFGYRTLALNTTGQYNAAFGYDALSSCDSGENIVAFGCYAGAEVLGTGYGDPLEEYTIIGSQAANRNKYFYSAVMGYRAGYYGTDDDSIVGSLAVSSPSTSSAWINTAIGYKAFEKITEGAYSAALGYMALSNGDTRMDSNFGIGSLACKSVINDQNNVCVGYNSDVTMTEYGISLGANSTTVGNGVALGADSVAVAEKETVFGTSFQIVDLPGALVIYRRGTGGSQKLYLNGGNFVSTSDIRLKNLHGEFNSGLEQIRKLKPYNFTFKNDKEKTPRVGVIAQDLKKVFPNSVTKGEKGYLMIGQDEMFYTMINSIKELDKIVENLKKEAQTLFAKIQMFENKIATIIEIDKQYSKELAELEKENKALSARLVKLQESVK